MGLMGLLNLEGMDIAAFFAAQLAGFVAGQLMHDEPVGIFVAILTSYHLFLLWLILNHPAKAGLAMPVWATVLTHAGCMVLVVAPATALGRSGLTFGLFRYGVVALALFERNWLFSKEASAKRLVEDANAAAAAISPEQRIRATAEDELAWLEYLKTRRPGTVKPGITVPEEHQIWLRARQKQREQQAAPPRQAAQQQGPEESAATVS
jgi:hypothetical protein